MAPLFPRFSLQKQRDVGLTPKVDVAVSADGKTRHFHLEVPGIEEKDLSIRVRNGRLTVSGHRESRSEQKEKNFHRIESSSGAFSRSFSVPHWLKASDVHATLEHGVLNIDIPNADIERNDDTQVPIKKIAPKQ